MKKKILIFFIFFAALLIAIRIALPYWLLHYVENKINQLPDYRVKIADIDVHLYRGAYTIKNIQLWKITKKIPVPFYQARTMDFSIEWRALLNGSIVAKIIIQEPNINFVIDPTGNNEQLTISKQWLDIVKNLYPLNINRLDIHKGQVALISYKGKPPYKMYIKNIEAFFSNMQRSVKQDKLLASTFSFNGDTIGGGNISILGQYDPLNKIPTFQLKAKLTALQVAEVAPFLKHYTSIDFSGGVFSLYGEAVAAKGKLKGYAKPFLKRIEIGKPDQTPIEAIVNGAVSVVSKILENGDKKTVATRVNISGNIDDPNTSVWSIMGYLLQHAFIQALIPQLDHSVKMQDVMYGKPTKKVYKRKPFPHYHEN